MIELNVTNLVGGNIVITTTPPVVPSPYFTYDSNRVITGLVQGSPNEYHSGTYEDWNNGYEDPETGDFMPSEVSYSVWSYAGSNMTDSYALGIAGYAFDNHNYRNNDIPYDLNIQGSWSFPNLTSIGLSSFERCTGLTSISIPNVTRIENSAFQDCSNLTSLSLPNIVNIYAYAFGGCNTLTSVTLGSDIQTIGEYAFDTQGNPVTLTIEKTVLNVQNLGFNNGTDDAPYSNWGLPYGSTIVCTDGTISIE